MAKALLLLRSTVDAAQQEALSAGLSAAFDGAVHTTAQLFDVPAENLFYDPASPWPLPDFVVELLTAPGKALADAYASLESALAGLQFSSNSLALVMQERAFIPSAPQDCHYYQLMFRKPGLSRADYLDYYSRFHCRMGFNTPGIVGYSQNYVDSEASSALAARLSLSTCDAESISELRMPSAEEFVANPEVMAVAEPAAQDESRFVDRSRALAFTAQARLRIGNLEQINEPVFPQHFPD